MSEHTPGPWQVIPSWGDWTIEGPNKEEIIFQDGPYQTPTIKLENARLIAAAPDLLEALQAYLEAFENHGITNTTNLDSIGHIAELAYAAIDKATGVTNAN